MKKIASAIALTALIAGCSSSPRYSNSNPIKEANFDNIALGYSFPDSTLKYVVVDGEKYTQGSDFQEMSSAWEQYRVDKGKKSAERLRKALNPKEESTLEKITGWFNSFFE